MRGSCSVASIMPVHKQLVHITLPVPLHGTHLHEVGLFRSMMPLPEQIAHARYPLPCTLPHRPSVREPQGSTLINSSFCSRTHVTQEAPGLIYLGTNPASI
jgi:hypothetical protein